MPVLLIFQRSLEVVGKTCTPHFRLTKIDSMGAVCQRHVKATVSYFIVGDITSVDRHLPLVSANTRLQVDSFRGLLVIEWIEVASVQVVIEEIIINAEEKLHASTTNFLSVVGN